MIIRSLKVLLIASLGMASVQTWGQGTVLNLYSYSDTIENIAPLGLWWVDTTGSLASEQVWPARSNDFHAFYLLPDKSPRSATVWAVFRISGVSQDTLHRIWFSNKICDYFRVFHFQNDKIDSVEAGNLVPYYRLPLAENFMAIPTPIQGETEQTVLLQFHNVCRKPLAIKEVFLLTPQDEIIKRTAFHDLRKSRDMYYFVFLSVVGFLYCFFLIQWVVQRNPAILYYCLYLATCGLYYLRLLENSQFYFRPLFKHTGSTQYHWEILIAFCSYAFYMTFVRLLLELPRYRPFLARYLHWGALFFLVAIPVMWLMGSLWSTLFMTNAYVYVRFIFALSSLYILGALWIGHRAHPLTKFITTGTFLLLMGMVMTLSEEIFGGVLSKNIAGGAFGWYSHPNGITLPVYDFKVGVLLEILIFSFGLAYRQRLLNEEYKMALSRIQNTPNPPTTIGDADEKAPNPYPFPVDTEFIQAAIACVEENMANEDFNVEMLAKALNVTRKRLYQRTKKSTGLDPSIFLRTIRLTQAKRLLEEKTTASISEIAYQVGFRHPYYFAKVFKKQFGSSPKDFKNQKKA